MIGQPTSFDTLLHACELPRAEARTLMTIASGHRREWLIGHGANMAPMAVAETFEHLCALRLAGKPMAYLQGFREFYGRRFEVDESVLIPRHETELLVELSLQRATDGARVLELGTGSGCVAITLACERDDLQLVATDVSAAALATARRNAAAHGVDSRVDWRTPPHHDDWWSPLAENERFALIVSNPPYVAANDPHLAEGDLRFEPVTALTDSSGDGLASITRIVAGARARLLDAGWLLIEHGYDQGAAVRGLMHEAGLESVETLRDLAERDRVTVAACRI